MKIRCLLAAILPAAALLLTGAAGFEPLPPPEGADFSPYLMTVPLCPPVEEGTLTSPFGWRTHPVSGELDFHWGADIAVPEGTAVSAAFSGTVAFSGWQQSYGNYILLDHYNGFATLYAHCAALLVKEGERVEAGEKIALSGQTGETTGPHLHFELKMDGCRLDPGWLPFFARYGGEG